MKTEEYLGYLLPQSYNHKFVLKNIYICFQIQFCIIFYHNFSVMFSDCNYPKGINFLLSLNAGIFLYMFGMFYYNNYVKSRRAAEACRAKDAIANGNAKEAGNGSVNEVPVTNGKAKEC